MTEQIFLFLHNLHWILILSYCNLEPTMKVIVVPKDRNETTEIDNQQETKKGKHKR